MSKRSTRGGYLYASDGTRVNEADILRNATDGTGAQISMDEVHAFVNRGIVFSVSRKLTISGNSSAYLVAETNGAVAHFVSETYRSNEGGVEVRLFENPTFSGGTEIQPINKNRTSDNTSTLTIKQGVTVNGNGTELYLIGMPASASFLMRGEKSGADNVPWVLQSDTSYAIEIRNLTGASKDVYVDFVWYEVEQ